MDHELICTWLGLPAQCWPPDHYTLLGLQPGESDGARIEQHVHERLARLRCYQISHPGPATEAMNRLAQAFVCLSDREAKRAYDAQFFPQLVAPPEPPPPAVAQPQTEPPVQVVATLPPPAPAPVLHVTPNIDTEVVNAHQTQLDWNNATPPPVRSLVLPAAAGTPAAPPAAPANAASAAQTAPAAVPTARPVDPVFETARSAEARRGLGSRRALLERILTTRRLLRAWERAGKYLGRARRKLVRAAEENELTRMLERIDELLQSFPALLGHPGQPGYRVLALAHDDKPAAMFTNLEAGERDALARDWVAGQALLHAHRQFLRQELKRLRRRGPLERVANHIRAAVNDHPLWVSLALLLVIAAGFAMLLV
jgi:hypothetical protein